jgi:UDP-N-acetylmuramoyl-L-alanyl-D-glutamate--2,6-diaminopimelate ligase
MDLADILVKTGAEVPARGTRIARIENDSRKCDKYTLYIAASGYVEDAHPFATDAFARGCRRFLVQAKRAKELAVVCPGASFYAAPDIKHALAEASKAFYDDPSSKMTLYGITGTSGKTSTAFAVYTALRGMSVKAGLVGTIEYRVNDRVIPATNTTPDLLALNRLLAEMVSEGCSACVMEISSHSLALGRVEGLSFDIGAFTNFSQDHLDFHKTMDAYFEAKLGIFELLASSVKPRRTLVASRESARYPEIAVRAETTPSVSFVSTSLADSSADYYAEDLSLSPSGTSFTLRGERIESAMVGKTNAWNFAMAAAMLCEAGYRVRDFAPHWKDLRVRGRMETVPNTRGISVIVDYAHKPDALEKVIGGIRSMLPEGARLLTVVGCGGDRDRAKRPLMGGIAGRHSDYTILTSDNPRTEDPFAILAEIEAGISPTGAAYRVTEDRALAIREAVRMASPGDCVLIAGKGHEDYQIIGKEKHHFDDVEEARKALEEVR